jgi:hypothetical protein
MAERVRREASHADFEELRAHVPLPRPASVEPDAEASSPKISVMSWLVEVGHNVARRFRGGGKVPPSPVLRMHGR